MRTSTYPQVDHELRLGEDLIGVGVHVDILAVGFLVINLKDANGAAKMWSAVWGATEGQ
jgi:hypothetical protein